MKRNHFLTRKSAQAFLAATLAAAPFYVHAQAAQETKDAKPKTQSGSEVKADSKETKQPAVKRIADVIRELGHKDFNTREEAMYTLLQSEKIKSSQIVQAYRHNKDLEIRSRLKRILWHYLIRDEIRLVRDAFARHDSGRLGIRFPQFERVLPQDPKEKKDPNHIGGILVQKTTMGLPAYAHLRPGDRILVVDGKKLTGEYSQRSQKFRSRVMSHRPGDWVEMKVLRRNQIVHVKFKYGSAVGADRIYPANANNDALDSQVNKRLTERLEAALGSDELIKKIEIE